MNPTKWKCSQTTYLRTNILQKIDKVDSVSFTAPSINSNPGLNPFHVVKDLKMDNLCEAIKISKCSIPPLPKSMMANQGLVNRNHDMTNGMAVERVGIPSMHSSTILLHSKFAAPAASTKPPPLERIVTYEAIADGECFLHYIKCCGETSVEPAALTISQILKQHCMTLGAD